MSIELYVCNEDYQPVKMVDTYTSLLWTERYATNGDWQLTTTDVENTLNLLLPDKDDPDQLEKVVCLRDSTVPMVAEVFKIEKAPQQAPLLTVTGRTYDICALERRAAINWMSSFYETLPPPWSMAGGSPSDAAYQVMREVFGDIARAQGSSGYGTYYARDPAVDPRDAIPGLNLPEPADFFAAGSAPVWDTTVEGQNVGDFFNYPSGSSNVWMALGIGYSGPPETGNPFWQQVTGLSLYPIPADSLYTTVMNLLAVNYHGIKSVRPTPTENQIDVEIYNGADLTESVVFDARFDQFDSATYLLSQQGSTNVGYIYGTMGAEVVNKTITAPAGMARRVLFLDDTQNTSDLTAEQLANRALISLYQYNDTAMFDGQISVQIADLYNRLDLPGGYSLGDILTLVGEYGLSETVRVAEFIRSADNTGEKSYPTFEVVDA